MRIRPKYLLLALILSILAIYGGVLAVGKMDDRTYLPVIFRPDLCPPGTSGPTVHDGGQIIADETWTADGSPHLVNRSISVDSGVKLTIEPCAMVMIAPGIGITVNGELMALGTETKPIRFRNLEPEPWKNIHIYDTAGRTVASFAYVDIENGGSNPTSYDGASLVVTTKKTESLVPVLRACQLMVKNSGGTGVWMGRYTGFSEDSTKLKIAGSGRAGDANHTHPIHLDAGALGTLPDGEYGGNAVDAIEVDAHLTITSDVTVRDRGVPYHIIGQKISVWPGTPGGLKPKMTFESGVDFRFEPTSGIVVGSPVNGGAEMTVAGTGGKPVRFSAWDSTEPWQHIIVVYPATATLTHVRIENGGMAKESYDGASLVTKGDTERPVKRMLKVNDVTVLNSGGHGVYMWRFTGFTEDSENLTISGSGAGGPQFPGQPIRIGAAALGTLPTGDYTGNGKDTILVDAFENIHDDTSVIDPGVPYELSSPGYYWNVYQKPEDGPAPTLTLRSGVELQFPEDFGLAIGSGTIVKWPGALQVLGTPANPIVFTSTSDSPTAGAWRGIVFSAPPGFASNRIQHARIEYAGGNSGYLGWSCNRGADDGAILFIDWIPWSTTISGTEIAQSAAHGVVRGWEICGDSPDFSGSISFSGVSSCEQTNPRTPSPHCQDCKPCF